MQQNELEQEQKPGNLKININKPKYLSPSYLTVGVCSTHEQKLKWEHNTNNIEFWKVFELQKKT